jgi:hypothetical protein
MHLKERKGSLSSKFKEKIRSGFRGLEYRIPARKYVKSSSIIDYHFEPPPQTVGR